MTPEEKALEEHLARRPDATAEAEEILNLIDRTIKARLEEAPIPKKERTNLAFAKINLDSARQARKDGRPDAALVDAVNAVWLVVGTGVRLRLRSRRSKGGSVKTGPWDPETKSAAMKFASAYRGKPHKIVAETIKHLSRKGIRAPAPRTIRRWIDELKPDVK